MRVRFFDIAPPRALKKTNITKGIQNAQESTIIGQIVSDHPRTCICCKAYPFALSLANALKLKMGKRKSDGVVVAPPTPEDKYAHLVAPEAEKGWNDLDDEGLKKAVVEYRCVFRIFCFFSTRVRIVLSREIIPSPVEEPPKNTRTQCRTRPTSSSLELLIAITAYTRSTLRILTPTDILLLVTVILFFCFCFFPLSSLAPTHSLSPPLSSPIFIHF